jgi:mono/diheme cytochrome c family protein
MLSSTDRCLIVLLSACALEVAGCRRDLATAADSRRSLEAPTDPTLTGPTPAPTAACVAPVSAADAALALGAIKNKCANCHTSDVAPDLSTPALAAAAKSQVETSVRQAAMPPVGATSLDSDEQRALYAWAAAPASLALAETPPTWTGAVAALMEQKCATCHSPTARPALRSPPDLLTYDDAVANATRSSIRMHAGTMPPYNSPAHLEADDAATLDAWIIAGFPKGTDPAPLPSGSPVLYNPTIVEIQRQHCTGCHSFVPGARPQMGNYKQSRNAALGGIMAVRDGSMPFACPMPPDQAALYQAWFDAGMPEGEPLPDPVVPVASVPPPPTPTPLPPCE